jgi:hypothetical protein
MNISAPPRLLVAATAYQPPTFHNPSSLFPENFFKILAGDQIPQAFSLTPSAFPQLERNPPST